MRSYDFCFQPISVGGSVFFGSSADDTLYFLDATNGQVKWSFTTDGPIRTAPSFTDGKLFFGSDDGFAYCLKAEDGSLAWKFDLHGPEATVKVKVIEMDEKTETLVVVLDSKDLRFDKIEKVISSTGASLHSIDEVTVTGTVDSP